MDSFEMGTYQCLAPLALLCIVVFNIYHIPPQFQLEELYIPALDKSINTTSPNTSITFHFYLEAYPISHVYYDSINVTFYANPKHKDSIATFTIPEFDQEENTKVDYGGTVNATGLDFEAAKREITTNGFTLFRVELEASVRYDCFVFWKTGWSGYRRAVDVKITDTGAGAADLGINILFWVIVTGVVLLLLVSYILSNQLIKLVKSWIQI
ncbi:hypothetical protein LUZ61_020544 [Rhynchospora tenuis]|uniref:Uncharacterized protein n=1 Tax=Rhynchospora tenuis TaxID=198213 RepID=A0AAD6ENW4_9POAL|nr:hypothetical protein LUZ61_020544 [Rhynchospora tenuis]